MLVELFCVEGGGEGDEEGLDASNDLAPLEMAQPPVVGDFIEWEIRHEDQSLSFLVGRVTSRAFHVDERARSVTCRLKVALCREEDMP